MKQKIILEIRAGEGGQDANLLVQEMAEIYEKAAKVKKFIFNTIQSRKGYISICL